MNLESKLYFFTRSQAHRAMAAVAVGDHARGAHTELAARYASKAEDVAYREVEPRMPCIDAVIANENDRRRGG